MPRLEDYLGDRKPLTTGNYDFVVKEAVLAPPEGNKEHPTIQVKGKVQLPDGGEQGNVVFLYLHPNCYPMIAEQLLSTGALDGHEVDFTDGESVLEAVETLVGQTLKVRAKQRTYNGDTKTELTIKGIGNAASAGRV